MTYTYRLSIGPGYAVTKINAKLIRYKKTAMNWQTDFSEQEIIHTLYNFGFRTNLNTNHLSSIIRIYRHTY
jgi:hypothetical protein